MNKLTLSLLAFLFVSALIAPAKDTAKALPYFDPATIDLKTLLGDPPADNSDTTKSELVLILQKQAARTPEEVARIKREVKLDVWLFDTVFGAWFATKNLPVTTELFARLEATEHPVIDAGKKLWNRPRPFLQDSQVHPPIDLPKNASYPSGHSTVGNLYGMVLAEIAPDLKTELLARGQQIGDDRIIAGVHFPSDVAAGKKLAAAIFEKLNASPDFQADVAKAKAEIAAAKAQK